MPVEGQVHGPAPAGEPFVCVAGCKGPAVRGRRGCTRVAPCATASSSLAAAIRKLASDRTERDRLGAAAKAGFEARWTERVSLANYFDLIRSHAEQKGRTSVVERLTDASPDGRLQSAPPS